MWLCLYGIEPTTSENLSYRHGGRGWRLASSLPFWKCQPTQPLVRAAPSYSFYLPSSTSFPPSSPTFFIITHESTILFFLFSLHLCTCKPYSISISHINASLRSRHQWNRYRSERIQAFDFRGRLISRARPKQPCPRRAELNSTECFISNRDPSRPVFPPAYTWDEVDIDFLRLPHLSSVPFPKPTTADPNKGVHVFETNTEPLEIGWSSRGINIRKLPEWLKIHSEWIQKPPDSTDCKKSLNYAAS